MPKTNRTKREQKHQAMHFARDAELAEARDAHWASNAALQSRLSTQLKPTPNRPLDGQQCRTVLKAPHG